MPYLLYITVSPMGANSKSRSIGEKFLEAFKASHPDMDVVVKDLSATPVPHLDGETLFYGYTPEDKRPETMVKKHEARVALAKEVIEASHIVIATPMWNWGPPSVLKAYIDQIIQIGVLDPYTQQHLKGKSWTVIIASGGGYSGDSGGRDFESNYLDLVGELLGSTNRLVIRSEFTMADVVAGMQGLIPKKEESYAAASEAAVSRANSL
jgi:FMN-dependent NADH-azoreductase